MSAESAISWLARTVDGKTWHQGHTLNPWSGCYVKSDGCRECYAKNLPPAMRRGAVWGPREMRVLAPDSYLAQAHAWNRAAEKLGIRMPVFCASTADIFERHVVESERERLNGQRAKVWALVAATPWLDWLFLTKEPENILDMIPAEWRHGCPANVWMGCTVENQKAADTRIPHLLRVPAVVRFLSVEPMVGPIDLDKLWCHNCETDEHVHTEDIPGTDRTTQPWCSECDSEVGSAGWLDSLADRRQAGINWILCGGESGRGVNVRPMHPQWARSLRDQCVAANVAFHFKQHGEWLADNQRLFPIGAGTDHPAPTWGLVGPNGHRVVLNAGVRDPEQSPAWADGEQGVTRVGKKASGRVLDGRTWDELPEAPRG